MNNAVSAKLSQINAIHSQQEAIKDAERRRIKDSTDQAEAIRKAQIAKEMELKRMEAEKKEAEARKKLKQ